MRWEITVTKEGAAWKVSVQAGGSRAKQVDITIYCETPAQVAEISAAFEAV